MQCEEVLILKQRSPPVGGYAIAKSVRAHRCATQQAPRLLKEVGELGSNVSK
ncbi:hypothetical protein [Nostoc sp. NOS(2021)]|uniref:hypothetical protein n=1 Tax=Nostoc sp. NOS(2021) TaxID=2815407 RepID=UPI0025D96BC1|nr:hypothetical protein [Nostoc sp. NOS(2021)]